MCTVDEVVLAELVRECELSGPEELAGAAALFALLVACFAVLSAVLKGWLDMRKSVAAKSRAPAEALDAGAATALGAAGTVSSSSENATKNQPKSRSVSGMASP